MDSPRFQTLPSASWAYQATVSSVTSPSSETRSRTTVAATPLTFFFSSVTVTTTSSVPSSFVFS